MAEDINGALGIRATIDADDIKTSAQQWVETITGMQSKTNEVVQGMNDSLSSLQKQVDEFGRTANGMSLSELSSQLNNSKAAFVSLGGDIRQQKYIIKETTADLGDLQRAYKKAKDKGYTLTADKLLKQIDYYKEGLAVQRRELNSMVAQQQVEKDKITELTQAYKELQSSQPTFENVTQGAQTAEERMKALKDSFDAFQASVTLSQQGINELGAQGAQAKTQGDEGQATITRTIDTRYTNEGAEETVEKTQLVKDKIDEVSTSYARSLAASQTAFNEQKNLIGSLEGQIANLQQVMMQAIKAGDMDSAAQAAKQIQVLEEQLTNAKSKLEEFQKSAEDAQKKLTDFANKTPEIEQRLDNQSTAWGRLKDRFSMFGDRFCNWLRGDADKGKQAISQFTDIVDGMGIPLTKSIKGFSAMTKSAIGFIATPLGAVLAAIVLVLKSVYTYLNKSAEGQKILAKVSAFFGSIMQSVTDIVIAFGKYLYKTFSGSNKAVNEFATNFVSAFKNAFHAVKDLAVGFGTIFKGVWQVLNGDLSKGWESMKEGVAQMGSGFSSAVKAISDTIKTQISGMKAGASVVYGMFQDKDFNNSISKSFGNMFSNAKEASDRALKALQLSKETDQAKMRALALDEQIAKGKEKIYTLTGKAKDEEIKRVKALEKEKYYGRDVIDQKTKQKRHEDGILDVQRKQYENLKATNALHTQTLGTLKAERQAHIGILQTEARAAASTRMLTRMEAANQRKMASQAKTAAKSALNKSNAVTSAQSKINDVYMANADTRAVEAIKMEKAVEKARIGAMSDGYARTKAEREAQDKDELDAIAQQQEAAIKAEIKRQKAEFEAEQALVKANGGKIQKWDDSKIDKNEIDKINSVYKQLFNFTKDSQTRKINDELAAEYDKQQTERKQKINKLKADIAELEEQLQKATNESEKAELKKLKDNAQAQLEWVSQSKDAWNEYYEKYGTFLEKRAALEEKYLHDTQGLDKDSPEYKFKQKEYENASKALEFEEIKKQLNWEDVFGDLSRLGKSALADLKKQLESLIENDKNLSIESIKTINEAINKVRSEQTKKGFLIGGMFDSIKTFKVTSQKAREARNQVERVAGGSLWRRYNNATTTEGKASVRNEQVYDPVTGKLVKFGDMLDRASKSVKEQTEAQKNATQSIKSVGNGFSTLSNVGKDVSNMLGKFGVTIPGGLGKMFDGFGEIGSAFEGFDLTKIGSFLDVGNYIHAVTGVFSGIADVFGGIFSIFGKGSGEKEYREELKHYNKLSDIWKDLIAKKQEYINLSFGDSAKKEIEDVLSLYKAEETSIKKLGLAYEQKRSWNAHSQGYRNDKSVDKKGGWKRWGELAGVTISSVNDFFTKDFTYEQLLNLKSADNGEFWASLDSETQDYLDKLIECKDGTEKFQETALEKLTGIKFDDMYSNFMSALSDMSKGADDFVQDFKNNMLKALIENTMGDKVKEWMDDYVKRYQAAVKLDGGKISETEAQKFRQELSEASNKFFNERQQIANSIGQGSAASSGEQKQGFATASEDSIEELSGRALAQTEALYQIRDQQLLDASTITSIDNNLMQIVVIENKRNAYYDETLELHRNSVSHLAAIERNTNELYSMNEKLTKIERNTRNI